MISKNIKKNNKIINIKDININEKEEEEDIYDINKFGITKINNKINNNQFNIILLDKKSENIKYIKKPSFLSCISNSDFNQENLVFKETKSENKDESCEKLQYRMNGLFFNKDVLRKIGKEYMKKNNNNSVFLKESNSSININNLKIIEKDNNIQKKLEDTNLNNNSSLSCIPNGNEEIKININDDKNIEQYLSKNSINENINIDNLSKKDNENNNIDNTNNKGNDQLKFKLKISRSFSSFPNNLEKDSKSEKKTKELKRRKSIISQDLKNNKLDNIFGSFNEVLQSMDGNKKKEYNFTKKETKRYKTIDEIREDKNYFRFLYLSSNLIEIIKKNNKYQMIEEENKKKKSISDINNQNYYIYTNDRNVLKLTALYFQKVKKAIFLFNTGKFENSYNSLLEDKIIKDKTNFALFLLIIEGIDKDKLYLFLSKNIGINNNFTISKLYLSFFNFANQTIIISFNFLLEALNIPSKNNDNIIFYIL